MDESVVWRWTDSAKRAEGYKPMKPYLYIFVTGSVLVRDARGFSWLRLVFPNGSTVALTDEDKQLVEAIMEMRHG